MKISPAAIFLLPATFASLSQAHGLTTMPSLLFRHLQQEQGLEQGQEGQKHRKWWEFGLADEVLEEVALYYLGQTWHQSAEVAEVLETISRHNNSDPWSWTNEWRRTAERMELLALESYDAGHNLTAGQAYLRAATYYRASLHRHPDPFAPDVPILAQLEVDAFEKFLSLSNYPCESVHIPYEDTTLPGYLCINPNVGGPAPTILFNEGKDGWAEDGKYVVDEAMKRGMNVLLWDGPGMGKTIRLQGLPFRHDWENVITPLIDYLTEEQLEYVDADQLAVISISLGGILGPRAAIFEHRLKAMIPNPGVMNWFKVYEHALNGIDPDLMPLFHSNTDAFDAAIYEIMSFSDFMHWGLIDSMWHHGVETPSALMLELEQYNIENMVQNITTPNILVMDAEEEQRGQAIELYEALPETLNKKYIKFTTEEAAQFHVQPGATAILSARMFDWLDEVFEFNSFNGENDNMIDTATYVVEGPNDSTDEADDKSLASNNFHLSSSFSFLVSLVVMATSRWVV